MNPKLEQALSDINVFLTAQEFSARYNTQQTRFCLLALLDKNPRSNLLKGKNSLNEGARIHDILEFVRHEFGINVAENTRESYRKQSLKPLLDKGFITIHRSSTNDPKTHCKLHKHFEHNLRQYIEAEDAETKRQILEQQTKFSHEPAERTSQSISARIDEETITLSPGKQNILIKEILESFAPAFIDKPCVLYIGDTRHKMKYLSEKLKQLKIKIDKHAKAPDVILYSQSRNIVYIVEAVTSAGPINKARINDIEEALFENKPITFGVEYFTAFPDRITLRSFITEIAWGTQVWLAAEPFGLIIFRKYK